MPILNIEIKAKASNLLEIERRLLRLGARFIGIDRQIDTYFNVVEGRLKLREGNIENSLIYYQRTETQDLKKSEVQLQKLGSDNEGLKSILEKIHGTWKVVDKKRKIFFIDNVKFHIDEVQNLGSFVEIEAIDENGELGEKRLRNQCEHYVQVLQINPANFIDKSYSDMI